MGVKYGRAYCCLNRLVNQVKPADELGQNVVRLPSKRSVTEEASVR